MPSYLHLAYRRNARAAAKNYTVKPADNQEAVKKAREDFSFFCEYVANKPPASHHKDWHGHFVTGEDSVCLKSIAGPNIDLLGPRGPLVVSAPVATPNGWVPIGELQVGDLVFSEHGQLTEVVNISDYEKSPTWEVIFTDGASVRCDDQHLWKVRRLGTDEKGNWRTMTLNEIRTQKTVGIKGNGHPGALTQRITATCEPGEKPWLDNRDYPRYQIPVTQPVEYPVTELPLDPYLLGALLGDGSLSSNNLSLCSADPEIIERCSLGLPEDYRFKKVAKYGYNISHNKGILAGGKPSAVREILKTLGVYGKTSIDKFIPKSYLTASIPDREALLQGLLDTDGTVAVTGGVSFCTTSTSLVKDITELVQSLGGIATQRTPQLNTYLNTQQERVRTTTPSFTLGIKLPDGIKPFYLNRKAQRYTPCTKYLPCRSIKDIRPSTTEKVRCIEVADKCHTFLTKDYIVSHNSAKSTTLGLFTAWAIGVHTTAKMPLQILYLSYTVEIARPKSAAIKRIIESRKYQEVFPAVRLLKNVTSNEYWSVDHKFAGIESIGDEMFTLCAAGLKGSVTSKRSHLCLVGDTLVLTNHGNVPIATIYANPDNYQIATRNHTTDQIEWSNVAAVTKRNTKGLISIETECGNKIQCTPEHPFITADGRQKRAGDFSPGETIVGLSNRGQVDTLPKLSGTQKTNTENLHYVPQGNRGFCGPASVPYLSTAIFNNFKSFNTTPLQKTSDNLLQSFLQWTKKNNTSKKTLSTLWQTVSTSQSLVTMLFKKVRRFYACKQNARNWQRQLPAWLSSWRMEKTTSANSCKRLFNLRWLQHLGTQTAIKQRATEDQSLCPPYRSQSFKQYPTKFNHVVQAVPCSTSPDNRQSWEAVTISRVEFFSEKEEFVYDLEVSHSSHNFIANGLNVLNCLIDDCIKSATDIANPDIRKAMQDNWNAVISPTMFEGGRAICLGTRFRHDDIHATTFNEQNNWRQIVLSAIQQDPKTGDELSYWPEMWSLEYLKEKKRTAPVAFSFQYMNQIVRQGELSLAPELIVKAEIATEFDSLGIGVDLSAGIKEKNDYTVMVLGGRIDDRIHIIDYRRIRAMGNLEKLDEMKELLNDWSIIGKDDNGNYFPTFSTCDVWSEAVQYQASLEADFKRICLNDEGLHNLIWHPVKGFRADKLARFRGIIGMFEERKIIFNRFRNFTNLFEELTNFGVSSHDDCVDALVWLVNGLAKKGKLQFDY
jgi:hypothetical protein